MSSSKRTRKITNRPNIAIVYVRVSTGQQVDGSSLDGQERTVADAARQAGYDVEIVREEGRSGATISGRPALRDALNRLAAGQAAALYVSKIDRLARSTIDALKVAEQAEKQGWRLVALDVALDSGTPAGKLVLTLLAAVAEMERQRIGERHRDWHQEHRARGHRWGVDEGPKPLLPADVRSRIVAERQRGDSLRTIANRLNLENVPTARGGRWHASTIKHVIESPSSAA